MPGNPKRALGTVTKIEHTALEVAMSAIEACPAAHLASNSGPRSPLAKLWIDAVDAAAQAQLAVEQLANLLREKSDDRALSAFARCDADVVASESEVAAARWEIFKTIRKRLTQPDQCQPDGMPSFEAMSAKGDASFLSAVRWASERLGFPDSKIDWNSAPSNTAAGLLRWAKSSTNESTFWTTYGPQLLPPRASQKATEEERIHSAACRSNDELCRRFIAITAKAEAKSEGLAPGDEAGAESFSGNGEGAALHE